MPLIICLHALSIKDLLDWYVFLSILLFVSAIDVFDIGLLSAVSFSYLCNSANISCPHDDVSGILNDEICQRIISLG